MDWAILNKHLTIVESHLTRLRRLFAFWIVFFLLLPGCGSTMNPFDMRIVEAMSTQLSDMFVTDEVIVYEKEELDALKAVDRIPLKWKNMCRQ